MRRAQSVLQKLGSGVSHLALHTSQAHVQAVPQITRTWILQPCPVQLPPRLLSPQQGRVLWTSLQQSSRSHRVLKLQLSGQRCRMPTCSRPLTAASMPQMRLLPSVRSTSNQTLEFQPCSAQEACAAFLAIIQCSAHSFTMGCPSGIKAAAQQAY